MKAELLERLQLKIYGEVSTKVVRPNADYFNGKATAKLLFRASPSNYNYSMEDNRLYAPDKKAKVDLGVYIARGTPGNLLSWSSVPGVAGHYVVREPDEKRPIYISRRQDNESQIIADFNTGYGVGNLIHFARNNGRQDAEVVMQNYSIPLLGIDLSRTSICEPFLDEGSGSLREFHVRNRVPMSIMMAALENNAYLPNNRRQSVYLPDDVQQCLQNYYLADEVAIVTKTWIKGSAPRYHTCYCPTVAKLYRQLDDDEAPIPLPRKEARRLAKLRTGTKVCAACKKIRKHEGYYNLRENISDKFL